MSGADILLVASSATENWCSQICSQSEKSFSSYHEKAVSITIQLTSLPSHK